MQRHDEDLHGERNLHAYPQLQRPDSFKFLANHGTEDGTEARVVSLTVKPMSEDKNKHKRHKKHKGGKNKGGGGISQ